MWDSEGFGQTLRSLFGQCCCIVARWAGEPEQGTTSQRRSFMRRLQLSLHVRAVPSAHLSGYTSLVCLTKRPS